MAYKRDIYEDIINRKIALNLPSVGLELIVLIWNARQDYRFVTMIVVAVLKKAAR